MQSAHFKTIAKYQGVAQGMIRDPSPLIASAQPAN
jgi:hypothetical protein